jgi:branched-chain amino acid aminotransferase
MGLLNSVIIERISNSRLPDVDFNNLDFGKYISDHMFQALYEGGTWKQPKVMPYGNLSFSPAMLAIHYGQAVFEGMKAYRTKDGNISIFRVDKHFQRFNKSLERMCMPTISEELFIGGLHTLLATDQHWVPSTAGSSLYIRPVMFATEAKLGVKISEQYQFIIMTTPVGPYYTKSLRVKIEDTFVRASEGGVGFAKCAGNYGASFYPTQLAKQQGFDQVLWTDSREHKYIDEAGTMNVMFIIGNKLVTPELTSALLDGVTRESILKLSKELGLDHEERRISVSEIEQGLENGVVTEAFGAGTAAVVAPIASITINGKTHTLPEPTDASFQKRVKQKLSDIRLGLVPDAYSWNYIIETN